MASKEVIDTHSLLWYLARDARLGTGAKKVMDDSGSQLDLPIIALAEAAFIAESGRKSTLSSVGDLMTEVEVDQRIEIFPFSLELFKRSLSLSPIPETHDRIIAAAVLLLEEQGHMVSILR